MRQSRLLPVLIAVALMTTATPVRSQEWPRFRGPNGSGVSDAGTIPTQWSEADDNWRVDLPGTGHGSPVVWGDRLFLNAEEADGAKRLVLCLDAQTGERIWTREFDAAPHNKHRYNSFASSTPAVDADYVYVAWDTPKRLTLRALDHEGRQAWAADLGRFKGGHGFAQSPVVYGDLVVLGNDNDGESYLVAVDRHTGELRWKLPRRSKRATYSTPCVYDPPHRDPELIFTNWQHGITAVDPATGTVNWETSVFDVTRKERAIGSPIVAGDLVIGTCGFTTAQKHIVAVRPEAGENPEVKETYRIERAVPHVPTMLAYKNRLYGWSDKGIVSCYDARTGERFWRKRVGGDYFGSPVCVDGRLFCISESGEVIVLAAADEFRELARNRLDEGSHATPAVADGTMFIRTFSQLHSIGGE